MEEKEHLVTPRFDERPPSHDPPDNPKLLEFPPLGSRWALSTFVSIRWDDRLPWCQEVPVIANRFGGTLLEPQTGHVCFLPDASLIHCITDPHVERFHGTSLQPLLRVRPCPLSMENGGPLSGMA